ncbi:MAG TPA: peptide ABC transporter substrate-binding protein [Acidimicrobiales bacterium]|jgi:ABC-type oligopeptide transport system substrate-binding subunit|nr:peptide ABC transporter substrate-binding protein [Acidimicrobiales bacterium]
MPHRPIRHLFIAGLLSLSMIATSCGDSDEDKDSSSTSADGGTETTGGGGNAALAGTDCGTLEFDPDAPSGGTFTDYAYMSDSGTNTSFDPGAVQTLNEFQITQAIFDGLTDFDFSEKCQPELKGDLAESWEVNDDATQYTFTLKEGITYSNGTEIKASDFKAAWERAGSAELASAYGYLVNSIEGGEALQAGEADTLSGVTADDEAGILTIDLAAPNAEFASILVHPFFSPAEPADLEKIGNTTGWGDLGLTVGAGPFMLEKADEIEVVLVPNPEWDGNVYGDTEVKLESIVFKMTDSVETAFQTFEAGEGDSAPIPSGKYQDAMAAYPKNTVDNPLMGVYYFDFGADDPQVGGEENLKLRQAIALAIDRQELNDKVYEGTRDDATGIVPPGIPGYKTDICDYCEYDPERAKELFAEWEADGGELTSPIRIDFNEGGSHGDVAAIIQANLKDNLGIETELAGVAEDYFKVVAEPGGCQLCRAGWYADYPTYGNFMVDLFSAASIGGNNFGRFDNPEFEDLIAKAQAETDDAARAELYNQAEAILLNEQTHAVALNFYNGQYVFRDRVHNYDYGPLGFVIWERMAVEG